MVFERPNKSVKPQPSKSNNTNLGTQRSNSNNKPSKNNSSKRKSEKLPPVWLKHPLEPNSQPNSDASAGFIEYLRWMRSHDDYEDYPEYNYEDYKDIAKLQILQLAEENADYYQRLSELNKRTKLIAGENNSFEVTCPWRIRVGGHRGPESILLPAFDALGMPCILSSSLRGVARTQAIQQFITEGMTLQQAENEVMKYFGGLDADNGDNMGKVIFLDAYPKPIDKSGGLSVDITNNIWSWENNNLNYKPNPQTFFSLKQSTFVIGIRPTNNCNPQTLEKIKNWLIFGLQSGIGSQVNTGYGKLVLPNKTQYQQFFQVEFTIQGQLIHGKHKFVNLNQPYKKDRQGNLEKDRNNKLKPNTSTDAEVRTIALKSMLRYWFRVFALGVLPIGSTQITEAYLKSFVKRENTRPPSEVKVLEAILFGSITPQVRGWVQFQVTKGELIRPEAKSEKDEPGKQSGILIINYSSEAPQERLNAIKKLFTNLTWMMFHLGGIGQGARRPCYSRQGRYPEAKPPKWRGSLLIPKSSDSFWKLPPTVTEFKRLFRQRLQAFYTALEELTGNTINYQHPRTVDLKEAVDKNCRIIVCTGKEDFNKCYALAVLHSEELKINKLKNDKKNLEYDEILCGKSEKPSVLSYIACLIFN
ncbi:MAG: type III-B CRISPR module RAMP protein Cmr6 [Richelia sp. RM1_1_1]|nr:type III-B CRISPR module RAMP protein Cmr6 [Richelia sp. RM1_1_1]